jgi:hypothetical protein
MRRLVVGCLLAASVVAGAPGARASVTQQQHGNAAGVASVFVFSETTEETGTYTSTGQLGRGTLQFDTDYGGPSSGCAGDAPVGLTGTATLVRSDGAEFRGTVAAEIPCDMPTALNVPITVEIADGDRDIVGARLVFVRLLTVQQVNPAGSSGNEYLVFLGTTTATRRVGYWMLDGAGRVYPFGGVSPYGNAPTHTRSISSRRRRATATGSSTAVTCSRSGARPGTATLISHACGSARG